MGKRFASFVLSAHIFAVFVLLSPASHAAECLKINDFGAVPDDVTDTSPAFAAAINAAKLNKVRCILFGVGRYRFKTKPIAIEPGITLEGTNRPETMLIRDYGGADGGQKSFLVFRGGYADPSVSGTVYGGLGGGLKNMHIIAASGTSGGIGIWLLGLPGVYPTTSMITIENVEVFGEGPEGTRGSWDYSMYVDGSQVIRQTPVPPGGVSYGIRDIFVRASQFMDATQVSVFVNRGVAIYFSDLGVYGGQAGRNADLHIYTPSNSPQDRTYGVLISNAIINGTLNITNSTGVRATGVFGGVYGSGNSDCLANGAACN